MTTSIKSLQMQVAALIRTTQPDYDPTEATKPARDAAWEYWRRLVDPEGRLSEDERNKRAARRRKAAMLQGKIEAKKKRRQGPSGKGVGDGK